MTCPNVVEIKGRMVCKFDYIQNPFTYRKEQWNECVGGWEKCYTYLRAKEVEELKNE